MERFQGQRALVVDDSAHMRNHLCKLLEELGMVTTSATNGIDALIDLRKEHYHVMFTDLVMPELDGFELCEEVRKLPQAQTLPIVVVSTYSDSHYITKALRIGADDFLVKPISPNSLHRILKRVTLSILDEV